MSNPKKKTGWVPAKWMWNWRNHMTKHRQHQPRLDDLRVGDVSFYNVTVDTIRGYEFVTFYVGSDAILRHEGGIIENNGAEVVLDKRSWDSMVAALRANREAA